MPEMEPGPEKAVGLRFDKTVSLGHVLTAASMLTGIAVAYTTYMVTITDHERRIELLEKQLSVTIQQMNTMWSIKQDVAVIKDRLERGQVPGRPDR